MLDLSKLAVDPIKAREGVWVDLLGAKFKIARFNNREAEAARNQALVGLYEDLKNLRDGKGDEADAEDKFQQVQARVMADHVLLDWKNLGMGDKEIPYSADKAFEILSNPAYEDLYQVIFRESLKQENYAAEVEEKVKKDVKSTASS